MGSKTKPQCVYCGAKPLRQQKKGWPPVCRQHADLPPRDPSYPNIYATPGQWDTLRG